MCGAAFSQHAPAFAKVNHDQLRVCGCWPHLLFSLSIRSEAFYPTKMFPALIVLAQQFPKLRGTKQYPGKFQSCLLGWLLLRLVSIVAQGAYFGVDAFQGTDCSHY